MSGLRMTGAYTLAGITLRRMSGTVWKLWRPACNRRVFRCHQVLEIGTGSSGSKQVSTMLRRLPSSLSSTLNGWIRFHLSRIWIRKPYDYCSRAASISLVGTSIIARLSSWMARWWPGLRRMTQIWYRLRYLAKCSPSFTHTSRSVYFYQASRSNGSLSVIWTICPRLLCQGSRSWRLEAFVSRTWCTSSSEAFTLMSAGASACFTKESNLSLTRRQNKRSYWQQMVHLLPWLKCSIRRSSSRDSVAKCPLQPTSGHPIWAQSSYRSTKRPKSTTW